MLYELVGISATCFVLFGFLCNSEKNIRTLDLIGAAIFVVYGVLTRTWSTLILNTALIFIQLYKLHGIKRRNTMKQVKLFDNQQSHVTEQAKGADTD